MPIKVSVIALPLHFDSWIFVFGIDDALKKGSMLVSLGCKSNEAIFLGSELCHEIVKSMPYVNRDLHLFCVHLKVCYTRRNTAHKYNGFLFY